MQDTEREELTPEEYKRRCKELDASFARDSERADMRHTLTTEHIRQRVLAANNGGGPSSRV